MIKLGVLDINGSQYALELGKSYSIGHKSAAYQHDIAVDHPSVDMMHCIIDCREESIRLADIRSTNGTFVNGTRVAGSEMMPIVESTAIRLGSVEATLQVPSEGESEFLEEGLTSHARDISEIICNSPEHVASYSVRLKNSLKNSLSSTPNATTVTISNNFIPDAAKQFVEFLVPASICRRSAGSNTSARSSDSFYIPETQYPAENNNKSNNSTNTSVHSKEPTGIDHDDDFFIPETQEVVGVIGRLSTYPRIAFQNEDINETIDDGDKIPSSQFRICTQDFNGSDDDISNHSDDLLAQLPCSMVIPQIRHSTVQINDLCNDDEEIEKEMSTLQWSKRTEDDGRGSATPDDIVPVDGLVTPDIIEGIGEVAVEAVSQCSTPDIFADPEHPAAPSTKQSVGTENAFLPTQVFVKPSSAGNQPTQVFVKPSSAGSIAITNDAKRLVPESSFLPTQVFVKPSSVNRSIAIPNENAAQSLNQNGAIGLVAENLLVTESAFLPTQVFVKPSSINRSIGIPNENAVQSLNQNGAIGLVTENCLVTETAFLPTQVFIKPPSVNKSIAMPLLPPCDKENIGPQEEDSLALPATQVFIPPKLKSDAGPPSPELDAPLIRYDTVPPEPASKNTCFSSTLVDSAMQLSETSFKAQCNKLLDSDDDEMDEIIAPELVKQMRKSLEAPEPTPVTEVNAHTPEEDNLSKVKESAHASNNKLEVTPVHAFVVPGKTAKNNSRPQPAVNIDSFMFTPDFLGKEFSKDVQLQKLAEINWKNKINGRQCRSLFGHEDLDGNPLTSESDDSQDSFNDLLPHNEDRKSNKKTKAKKLIEKVEEAKSSVKPAEETKVMTRRRKSAYPEDTTEKKVSKRTNPESSKESKPTKVNTKKKDEKKSEATGKNDGQVSKVEPSHEKKDGLNKSQEKKHQPPIRERTAAQRRHHTDKIEPIKNDDKKNEDQNVSRVSEKILNDVLPSKIELKNVSLDKKNDIKKTQEKKQKPSTREKTTANKRHHAEKEEPIKDSNYTKTAEQFVTRLSEKIIKCQPKEEPSTVSQPKIDDIKKSHEKKRKHLAEKSEPIKASNDTKPEEHVPRVSEEILKDGQVSKVESPNLSHGKKDAIKKSHEKKHQSSSREKTMGHRRHHADNKESTVEKKSEEQVVTPAPEKTTRSTATVIRKRTTRQNTKSRLCSPSKEGSPPSRSFSKNASVDDHKNSERDTAKEEKPQPRLTRLKSKDLSAEFKTLVDLPSKRNVTSREKVSSSKGTSGSSKKDRPQEKNTIDLTDSDVEDLSGTTKRKNEVVDKIIKRVRSETPNDGSISPSATRTSSRSQEPKLKIATTSCYPKYQQIAEKRAGALWHYTSNPKECDVLIVEKGNRTYKLLVAIARGTPVVKIEWFIEVLKKNTVAIPFEPYIFEDKQLEKHHKFELKKSLNLARTKSLFDGISFMMTPGISPTPEEMEVIITCAGGTILEDIPKMKANQKIYLVTVREDKHHWHRYSRSNSNIEMVRSEYVMASVMQQSMSPISKGKWK